MFSPEGVKSAFYLSQILIGCAFVAALVYMRSKSESQSRFNDDELDPSRRKSPGSRIADLLADARINPHERKNSPGKPLQLPGIRLDGKPHEILGVSASAQASEIQRAYRDLMKRYHPDIVGPPGSRQWQDAQRIAEAINRAKEEMVKGLAQSQKPKRSGL